MTVVGRSAIHADRSVTALQAPRKDSPVSMAICGVPPSIFEGGLLWFSPCANCQAAMSPVVRVLTERYGADWSVCLTWQKRAYRTRLLTSLAYYALTDGNNDSRAWRLPCASRTRTSECRVSASLIRHTEGQEFRIISFQQYPCLGGYSPGGYGSHRPIALKGDKL